MSSTEWQFNPYQVFVPQLFIDVSVCFIDKIKALEAYSEEMRDSPHSRSIDHVDSLGKHRGHTIGVEYAEAFMIYRIIRG